MRRLEYEMLRIRDERLLLLSGCAPEYENHRLFAFIESGNHMVGKILPSGIAVRKRLRASDGQDGVEKKDSLARPTRQIALAPRDFDA